MGVMSGGGGLGCGPGLTEDRREPLRLRRVLTSAACLPRSYGKAAEMVDWRRADEGRPYGEAEGPDRILSRRWVMRCFDSLLRTAMA